MLLERKSRSSTDSRLLMMLPPCQQQTAQRQAATAQLAGDCPSLDKCDLGVEDHPVAVHFDDYGVSVYPLFDLEAKVRCVLHTHQRRCECPLRRGGRRAGAKPRAQWTQSMTRRAMRAAHWHISLHGPCGGKSIKYNVFEFSFRPCFTY
jgi:hypothetical protein